MSRLLSSGLGLAAVLVLAVSAATAQTNGQSDALRRAADLVQRARQAAEAERPGLARAALEALDTDPSLQDSAWLRAPLAANPPQLVRAEARLSAAREALQTPLAAVPTGSERERLQRILAAPPFQTARWTDLLPAWLQPAAELLEAFGRLLWNIIRWPFDRLLDLLRTLLNAALNGPASIPLALAVVVALVLLYRRGLRSAIVGQAELSLTSEPLPPTAFEALEAAHRDAAAGRYREACHFVLLSTLLWIEERGLARFDPAATNREHLARLADRPPLASTVAPLVQRFDRLWYGQDAVTDADYRDLLTLAGRAREVVA